MKGKRWLLVCSSLLILTGMRNPFQPPEDHCQLSELSTWRYQGAVIKGERTIGLVLDDKHKWRRVEQHDVLNSGWTVSQVTAQNMTIDTDKNCEPSRRQWQRQGEVNEAMDSGSSDDNSSHLAGGENAKRDAGGG